MSEKNREYEHVNVSALIQEIDGATQNINLSAKYKFFVKVGSQYGYRDTKSKNRYELSDKPIPFYSEVQANECLRALKLKHKNVFLEKELASV